MSISAADVDADVIDPILYIFVGTFPTMEADIHTTQLQIGTTKHLTFFRKI